MSISFRVISLASCCVLAACSSKVSGSKVDAAAGADTASAGGPTGSTGPTAPGSLGGASGSGVSLNIDAGIEMDAASSGDGAHIITTLPSGFQPTDIGGLLLGASLGAGSTLDGGALDGGALDGGGGGASMNGNCGNVLVGLVRDFRGANEAGGNPDFESPTFWGNGVTPNLVSAQLGGDQKPIYASQCELATAVQSTTCPYGPETTTVTNFNQWYRDTPSANEPFEISLYLAPQPGGVFTFQSLHYFPLDNAGFGNSGTADDGLMHNFSFTTEVHTQFSYNGGETFQFQGDDDVWVFINGKLAVDLGGLHPRTLGTVSLDAAAALLGLQKCNVYDLDLFHAERHTDKSTFRIDTNLSFVNCGTVEMGPK
jgi:fibro-slime domain-containing protein